MKRTALVLFLGGLFLLGCNKTEDTGQGGDTGPSDTNDTEDTDDTDDTDTTGDAPVILDAWAHCGLHSIGKKFYWWSLWCQADDPQGIDTLQTYGDNDRVDVLDRGGNVQASYLLACNAQNGECTGYFKQEDDNIICANAGTYTFRFFVADEDGNVSDPYEVNGEQVEDTGLD